MAYGLSMRTWGWLLCVMAMAVGCDDDRRTGPRLDSGTFVDAGAVVDGGPTGRDGGSIDGGVDGGTGLDGGPSNASVGLTFSGCSPSFEGDVVVVANADSIAVSATRGGALVGSIQLALEDGLGPIPLSTQHRVDSGTVINVVVGSSWTNIAMRSSEVLSGTLADPVGGTLIVRAYDESEGIMDVTFAGVSLQNPSDGSVCTVDGTLVTTGLSF